MVEFEENSNQGFISAIHGTLIEVKGLKEQIRLYDLIKIVNHNILSEVIQINKDTIIAQCFESTSNIKLKENVIDLGQPLSMELAPGLLAHVFDGIQRPLELTFQKYTEGTLKKGLEFQPLSREKRWHFIPKKKLNDKVLGGDVIGTVQETKIIEHKILVPYNASGTLSFIAKEGDYSIIEEIYKLKKNGIEESLSMLQKWPITKGRPFKKRLPPNKPLLTGIRTIDLLFPIAMGGTFAVPGGFGTGKTVIQQNIAKCCNADILIFIGCGEPGNEIANILKQFIENIDPKTKQPLIDRTIVIANTSNMPVSAREASLFSGVSIAEYYRDMGYDVAIIADSTSRWAESLREISSLLEEMPAEEGYPAYLPSKLSSFYERAGVIKTLGRDPSENEMQGSLTIIGSISPPGGDFNEPVTAATKRVVQGIWALDSKLAYLKQYPAIDWLNSYSNYPEYLKEWWNERDIKWNEIEIDWFECRNQINEILSKENDLKLISQITGEINEFENQNFDLFMAKIIRNGLLIQNAFTEIEFYTDIKKLLGIVKIMLLLYKQGKELKKHEIYIEDLLDNELLNKIMNIGKSIPNEDFDKIENIKTELFHKLNSLIH